MVVSAEIWVGHVQLATNIRQLPATGTGRGIPLGINLLPMEKSVPVAWVWVLAGRGTGTAENTHGLPV
jgi:hypothetical protein